VNTFIEFVSSQIALTADRSMMDIAQDSVVRAGFFSAVATVLLLVGVAIVVGSLGSKRAVLPAAGVVVLCYGLFMFFRPILAIDLALLTGFVAVATAICVGIWRTLKLSLVR